ncbi:hypothetical protein ACX5I6_15930 [Arthrobacter sp. MMS24-T111]
MIKAASTLTAIAVAGALLTGCSGSSGDSGNNNDDGPVTLTYWDFMDPSQNNPRAAALKQNLENFHKENPDITVHLDGFLR